MEISKVVKKFGWDILVKKALKDSIKKYAWLAWPGVGWVYQLLFNFAADYIWKYAEPMIDFAQIDFETNSDKKEYKESIDQFKEAATPEEIENAKEKVRKSLARAINMRPNR